MYRAVELLLMLYFSLTPLTGFAYMVWMDICCGLAAY